MGGRLTAVGGRVNRRGGRVNHHGGGGGSHVPVGIIPIASLLGTPSSPLLRLTNSPFSISRNVPSPPTPIILR